MYDLHGIMPVFDPFFYSFIRFVYPTINGTLTQEKETKKPEKHRLFRRVERVMGIEPT